jgi:hypothetical protein
MRTTSAVQPSVDRRFLSQVGSRPTTGPCSCAGRVALDPCRAEQGLCLLAGQAFGPEKGGWRALGGCRAALHARRPCDKSVTLRGHQAPRRPRGRARPRALPCERGRASLRLRRASSLCGRTLTSVLSGGACVYAACEVEGSGAGDGDLLDARMLHEPARCALRPSRAAAR